MKKDVLREYISLQTALHREREELASRLKEIETVLGEEPASRESIGDSQQAGRGRRGRRKMSPAARRKIGLAMKARWAQKKGRSVSVATTRKGKRKRKLSPEGRARIIAATKKRWAKVRAAAAK